MGWTYDGLKTVVASDIALRDYLRNLLEEGSFLITVFGKRGSGKSTLSMKLCELVDDDFSKDDIVDNVADFFAKIAAGGKPHKYQMVMADDFGRSLNPLQHYDDNAQATREFFQTFRTSHIGVIMNTPDRAQLNKDTRERQANFFIEILSKNEALKQTRFKMHRIQLNLKTGKIYYHNIFWHNGELTDKYLGEKGIEHVLGLPAPDLMTWYKKFRQEMGNKQIKRSAERVKEKQANQQTDKEIADKVEDNIGDYMMATKSGRRTKKVFNKSLVESDFSIGGRRSERVIGLLKRKGVI